MHRTACLTVLFLSATLFADDKPSSRLVAHEWGTFTSMQGSDGGVLEGMYHEEAGLPPFVVRRSAADYAYAGITRKIETPVLYFYTDTEQTVRVRVGLPEGVWTQWYPQAYRFGPDLASVGTRPEAKKGFLDWECVRLVPDRGQGAPLPRVDEKDPWTFARKTDSAFVHPKWMEGEKDEQWEKYLFYRGLGTFSMPVAVMCGKDGVISVHDFGKEAIEHVFVLSVADGHAAFSYLPRVEAGATIPVKVELHPKALSVDDNAKDLGKELQKALVACGLYEKEAIAMVRTWEKSYFHTEGIRVLYMVPRSWTDRLLPLTIAPKPDEVVRVLLARAEVLTPEHEAEVERWIGQLGSEDYAAREEATKGLASLGRFAEPNLRRVLVSATDPEVRGRAQQLLDGLMPWR